MLTYGQLSHKQNKAQQNHGIMLHDIQGADSIKRCHLTSIVNPIVEIRRYIDFAKAFDKVDFMVTLKKLKGLGISGKVGKWIHNFLTNQSQVVLVRNARSQPMAVKSGVPQGSVLGPLLFLVLIGDIDQGIARAFYTPAQRSWKGGILDSPCPSVRPSVCPSVCL